MLLLLSLLGCRPDPPVDAPPDGPTVVAGAPSVGAADGSLRLPVGTPLGGYTARCTCLGSFGKQDDRTSPYTGAFIPSTGVQTLPSIDVIWIDNGDDHLVLTKTDAVYSFDGLVEALEARLEAETGARLDGRVVHAANHSHSAWGAFSDQLPFFLGTDRYDEEIFQRTVDQIAAVALDAYAARQPAKIGLGQARDWDPNDLVYRDRRGDNDDLAVWPDAEPGMGKDPHLAVMRFDTLDDRPIAALVNFGMHGIVADGDSPMASGDAGAHLELALEETFDEPVVVMFTQGSGGDASPAGVQADFARMESIGALGAPMIRALYDRVATSADPIRMETASRSIPKDRSLIRVTRGGEVDWRYAPHDVDPDDVVYDEAGAIVSPIDEFAAPYGALFCGTGDIDLPGGGLPSSVEPYASCMDVEVMSELISLFFDVPDVPLPLPSTRKAKTTVTRLGPIPTLLPDGSSTVEEWLVGFFPGEATAMYGEQWRRRAAAELGHRRALMISYAQDHEGYLLIPEDWLLGGYEADITIWGPLEAEHVMEGVLRAAAEILTTDVHEDPDPHGFYAPTEYADHPIPARRPDPSPNAGALLSSPPPYLWTPLDLPVDLAAPSEVPRVQGSVQIAWIGGDPAVDSPEVTVERRVDGAWTPLRSRSGRLVTEAHPDILLAHTPDPLRADDAVDGARTHTWWAAWQAVGHVHDRAGLPAGTYRLRARGSRLVGDEPAWPWTTAPYEVVGPEFEVVPGEIAVELAEGGVYASLRGPADGFRLIHPSGDHRGDNPLDGPITVDLVTAGGVEALTVDATLDGHRSFLPLDTTGVVELTVTDAHGNTGTL